MAEITYQILLSTLQTVGLLVGISYYILSLRNQNRARQVQTYLSIYSKLSTPEYSEQLSELLDMEWDDYHDFEMKYGSDVNPENRSLRYSFWYLLDGIGFILKKGWVDRDVMFTILNQSTIPWLWEKHEPIIKEIRTRYNMPYLATHFEYLVEENKKMMLERGQSPEPPDALTKYIPDK